MMHRLLARQLQKVALADTTPIAALLELVSRTYEQFDRDRQRSDRSGRLMAEELDQRNLETLQSLEEQARRDALFKGAVDNMAHGLAIVTATGQLILTNRQFESIYQLPAGQVLPGQSMAQFTGGAQPIDADRPVGLNSSRQLYQVGPRTIAVTRTTLADDLTVTIHEDVTALRAAESQLERLAYYDQLTGLANRRLFETRVTQVLGQGDDAYGALMLLDLDRFKEVNDVLGHASGDDLLKRVSRRIAGVLPDGALLARLGGDEFAILLPRIGGHDEVSRLGGSIRDTVTAGFRLDGIEVNVDASIGAVIFPTDGTSYSDLLKKSDLAMYGAKEAGRGRFKFFTAELLDHAQRRDTLAKALKKSLATGSGLSLAYQPQVHAGTGRLSGFEALARWWHPTLGNIAPSEFVHIAETSNAINDLGRWVLRDATEQARRWLDSGLADCRVSVNVSMAQLHHGDVLGDVRAALDEFAFPPGLLCLELTESILADHGDDRIRTTLDKLSQLGIMLALDDFGATYSSLGYLARLPFQRLKVDRLFITNAAASTKDRRLLEGIVALARTLNMEVVGEGAETRAELEVLRDCGCDIAQGYVISRPIPPSETLIFAALHDVKVDADRPPRDRVA